MLAQQCLRPVGLGRLGPPMAPRRSEMCSLGRWKLMSSNSGGSPKAFGMRVVAPRPLPPCARRSAGATGRRRLGVVMGADAALSTTSSSAGVYALEAQSPRTPTGVGVWPKASFWTKLGLSAVLASVATAIFFLLLSPTVQAVGLYTACFFVSALVAVATFAELMHRRTLRKASPRHAPLTEVHAAIQALEQQNASLRALLGSVPTGEPTDAAALARVTEELEAVKGELQAARADASDLRTTKTRLTASLTEASAEADRVNAKYLAANQQIADLMAQLDKLTQSLSAERGRDIQDLIQQQNVTQKLSAEASAMERRLAMVDRELTKVTAEKKGLEQELEAANAGLHASVNSFTMLKAEFKAAQEALGKHDVEAEQAMAQLTRDLERARAQHAALNDELTHANEGLHASAKNYDMLKGDFQRFKAEAAQQNTALAAARAEVDRLTGDSLALAEENKKMAAELRDVMANVSDNLRDRQLDSLLKTLDKVLRKTYPTQDPADIYQLALKMLISYARAKAQGHAKNATKDQMRQDWKDATEVLAAQKKAGATTVYFLGEFCEYAAELVGEADFSRYGQDSHVLNVILATVLVTLSSEVETFLEKERLEFQLHRKSGTYDEGWGASEHLQQMNDQIPLVPNPSPSTPPHGAISSMVATSEMPKPMIGSIKPTGPGSGKFGSRTRSQRPPSESQ